MLVKRQRVKYCQQLDGFGGLVVSVLASGTRVRASDKSSTFLPLEGKWKNLTNVPALQHVQEPSNSVNYECASKIPCIIPSFASRGLSCLRGAWRLWRWMRGTHWGQGYNRPIGCSAVKTPQATFNFLTFLVTAYFSLKTIGPITCHAITAQRGYKFKVMLKNFTHCMGIWYL